MKTIALYVSDKKIKQFNRTGFCQVMDNHIMYNIRRKPEDMRLERKIAKMKAKLRALEAMSKPKEE